MAYTTIDDPSVYFQTLLYTGNATGSRALTNDGNSDLQPDWIWIKQRDSTKNHNIWDSSRGVTKQLRANLNNAEATNTTNDNLVSLNSDGFTLGDDTDSVGVNENSKAYVAWQWKCNGGTTSTDTNGSQNSTVQVNSTAGFSIVKRTGTGSAGATYGHGLGAVPEVIINKGLNTNEWYSYFKAIGGGTHWMNLDQTNAAIDDANMWHDTDATSTVFTVGNSGGSNGSSVEYIAYCFTPIQGYSSFGSYTGNANADGPFAYTGFKPAWVMIKNTQNGEGWFIHDSTVDDNGINDAGNPAGADGNPVERRFQVNENQSEVGTSNAFDFVSNGFKVRTDTGSHNGSGHTIIYMAFAESPFVSSEGVPTTAR